MRTAFSLASAPPFVKNTFEKPAGAISLMSRASSPRVAFAIEGWIVASRPACSWIAATRSGCWWPRFRFTSCDEKSR